MSTVRAIKLLESISVYTDTRQAKSLQYINVEADPVTWRGWEFRETEVGLEIIPPWKGDMALVPWHRIGFIQKRPSTPQPVEKKATK